MAPVAMRLLRHAFKKASSVIKTRMGEISRTANTELQPILVRASPRQPTHPNAFLRQLKSGRWYSTHNAVNSAVRRLMSTGPAVRINRSAFPKSATSTAVSRLTIRTPFASTLRPNLTGGAMPRTSGGYTLGGSRAGGARYFSHTPAAPAQVVNNVSAAVRAFWLSGQKAQFDGMTPLGEKRYRNITNLQEETGRKMRSVSRNEPGSFIDFTINPMVTALSPLGAGFPCGSPTGKSSPNLNTEGMLDVLSVDFARTLKDLAATMNDLKRLSSLGDLPVSLERRSVLRVRFPGCDAETVEKLCDEVGVQRGVIYQEPGFDASCGAQVALIFPFAPTSERTISSPGGSLRSQISHDFEQVEDIVDNPWLDGFESMEDVSEQESAYFSKPSEHPNSSSGYEGLEGIYRFIEECDNYRRS